MYMWVYICVTCMYFYIWDKILHEFIFMLPYLFFIWGYRGGIGYPLQYSWASLVAQMVENLPAMWETCVWSLDWEDPLEEGMATHSSILACRIPRTEGPGGLHEVANSWTQLSDWVHLELFFNLFSVIFTYFFLSTDNPGSSAYRGWFNYNVP